MRYITLNNEGELIADEGGGYSLVDYTKLAKEDFSKNVGVEYIKFGIISDYSNEIFINYYIRQKEWEYLIKEDDILVKSKGNSISHFLWNDLVERKNNPPQKSSSLIFLFPWAKLFLACLVCFTLVTLRKLFNFKRRKATAKSIAIVRSKASHSKLSLINEQESILLLSEDIVYRNRKLQSMFSYFSFGQCLIAMFKSIGSAFRDFSFLIREVDSIFGSRVTARIISNYSFRVALKSIYEQLLFCFLKSGLVSDLVTGNKEDRFAMVEKRLCAKFGVCLTCIPHGLEYTYKFPSGIAGNVFYCTSEKSKEVLSKIYPTILFVHDEHLQKSLYQLSEPGKYNKEEIVFFT
ncbi:hypothetical protein KIV40_27820, partial [Vibrio sp. D173a]|uniref:hypothetical protein n=1 Tax=Vibrio sp. D173a TaxID=2836349 RepID=UPI00255641CD